MCKSLKPHWFLVTVLLGIGLYLRLYRLTTPLADWHSFRQADTASVTREFVKHNYPIWEPRYHDHSNIQSGFDNPQGYRMVEFPLINYLTAQALKLNPSWDLVVTSRLVSIGFSLLGVVSLYGLIYSVSQRRILAFLSAFFMATLPYSVFYSRVVLPEPAMLGTQLASLWLFVLWLQTHPAHHFKRWVLYLVSLLLFALSLLLKPTAIFIIPVIIVLAVGHLGIKAFFSPWLIGYGLLGVTPLWIWRNWIQNFPEGIPASEWLLNGNGIRLRPAWWRWLFAERIGKLILGIWGVSLLSTGLVSKISTHFKSPHLFDWVSLTWTGSMFAYLVVFATGNVQHDYYQTLLIPLISLLLARGVVWLSELLPTRKIILWPSLLLILGLTYFFSWWEIRGYYDIQNPNISLAGQRVAVLTPPDAQVIAPYQGDTAFLFQTDRTGWPIGFEIEDKISKGAEYYVSVNYDDETNQLMKKYEVIEQTPEYVIIKLLENTQDSTQEKENLRK